MSWDVIISWVWYAKHILQKLNDEKIHMRLWITCINMFYSTFHKDFFLGRGGG
jgi:hypothetical protein